MFAPKAESVSLNSSGDIPGIGFGQSKPMIKGTNGVWEITLGPLAPGAYRYSFNLDGALVIDPRNPKTSESNENTWSLVYVPGAGFGWILRTCPQGASRKSPIGQLDVEALPAASRLHATPGYDSGKSKYPIFYLLHGAFDSDNSWSTVGRAGCIFDNLIAEGKAKPMVVSCRTGTPGHSAWSECHRSGDG